MPNPEPQTRARRAWLFLRGATPLLLVALLLLVGPTLLVWWWQGGAFSWRHLVIGGGISLALLTAMGLIFGWAVGRLLRGRRK